MLLRSLPAGALAAALLATPAVGAELSAAVGATGQGGASQQGQTCSGKQAGAMGEGQKRHDDLGQVTKSHIIATQLQ